MFFGVGLDVSGQLVASRELLVASDKVALEGTLVLMPHDVRLQVASLPVLAVAPCKNHCSLLNLVGILEINKKEGPIEVIRHKNQCPLECRFVTYLEKNFTSVALLSRKEIHKE